MLLKNLFLGSSLAAVAAAAPAEPQKPETFGLIAIHSTSPVHNAGISASQGRLWINHPQDAECETPSNFATFYVKDAGLYLYNENADLPDLQQFYVDRSGMGQGIMGYTPAEGSFPRNGERDPFAVNDTRLQFDGTSFQACPAAGGGYTIWLGGIKNPAQIEGCIQVALKAIPTDEPISCEYSE